jgi:hypothetical protein
VVERTVGARDARRHFVEVRFGPRQTLPSGPATFVVDLISDRGAQAGFRVTCAVLPSNPFTLAISPRDNFVTGSFSARAVRSGSSYVTAITATLSNGDSTAANVQPGFGWEFWDGGVGTGSRVENGTGSFGGTITVPAFGTWSGWIVFTSPGGSGVFDKLDGEEDMTLRITMTRSSGAGLAAEITVRTMFRFGLNITRVGAESFTGQEYTDLYHAVDVTRTIYEPAASPSSPPRARRAISSSSGRGQTTTSSTCSSLRAYREPASTVWPGTFRARRPTAGGAAESWWTRADSWTRVELAGSTSRISAC